jgi:hypothetical protein
MNTKWFNREACLIGFATILVAAGMPAGGKAAVLTPKEPRSLPFEIRTMPALSGDKAYAEVMPLPGDTGMKVRGNRSRGQEQDYRRASVNVAPS